MLRCRVLKDKAVSHLAALGIRVVTTEALCLAIEVLEASLPRASIVSLMVEGVRYLRSVEVRQLQDTTALHNGTLPLSALKALLILRYDQSDAVIIARHRDRLEWRGIVEGTGVKRCHAILIILINPRHRLEAELISVRRGAEAVVARIDVVERCSQQVKFVTAIQPLIGVVLFVSVDMLVTVIACTISYAKVVAYHSPSVVELLDIVDKGARVEGDIDTGRLAVEVT